jgi:parallel beta-helix repeat protein
MPTIDELAAAVSVSDTDEIMVSQSDIARKATRAQLLGGVQAALALPQNTLLGRMSAGIGSPETISIGGNLTFSDGTLDAPASFDISGLPIAGPPQPGDLVAVAQGGQNAAANFAAFMGGLGALSGISGSNLVVAPTGGIGVRRLADALADAISIESFGAAGDGVTDDTQAFVLAAQSGRPVRLDRGVYIVNGPVQIVSNATFIGVAGGTVIRRAQVVAQSPWIEISCNVVDVTGVIFDANALAAADSPVVQVDATCQSAIFANCQFLNAYGATSGDGLRILCAAGAAHEVTACRFKNNAMNGVSVAGSGTVRVSDCDCSQNGASGIIVAPGTGCIVARNNCSGNNNGITIGAWTSGAVNAGTVSCVVDGNSCSNNAAWGLAVGGYMASVRNNSIDSDDALGGGGIAARLGSSCVVGNRVSGGGAGIDARTSWGCVISLNQVIGTSTGMRLGGCQNVIASANYLLMNQWGIDISAVEPGLSYGLTGPVSVTGNWIGFTGAQGGAVNIHDGAMGIRITGNDMNGWGSATIDQALWLHTDQAIVDENRWNNQPRFTIAGNIVAGRSSLVVPDIADEVMVTSADAPITSIVTNHQADTLGQISFVRVTDGGSGYTAAQISIAGSGQGATAQAVVNGGVLLWIVVTNPGSGYGLIGTGAVVTISGDGSGAAATAYVGVPVLEGRRLRLACNCTVQLALEGTSPAQQNWTDFAATIPALGAAELVGAFGAWRAVAFPAIDYVQPTGDGGAVVQSVAGGDVTLRPSAGGVLQIASAAEPTGCTSTVGRGAPTGAVAAPPGSDFRNLDGGVGSTLWIKQTGTDATGWTAIA